MRIPGSRGGRQERAPGSELNLQGVPKRAVEPRPLCRRSPPPGNTGYTSPPSSSYEGQPRAPAAFRSPSMSRRSLRLHTPGGRYGDDSLADLSLSHCETHGGADRGETSMVRIRQEQQQQHQSSQSLLLLTHRSLPGSALHAQGSNASMLSSLLDESCVQDRTLFGSFWGEDDDVEVRDRSLLGQPDIHTAQTQTSMLNGRFCDDCAVQTEWRDTLSAYSPSPSLHSAHTHEDAGADAPGPSSSMVYCRKRQPGRAASGLRQWLGVGWYQLVGLMSLLDVFILTWCLPKLYRLLLLLLPLLLILGLWQRDSYGLLVLEAPTPEEQVHVEGGHTAARASEDGRADAGRLGLLENRVSQLWEGLQRGGWQSRRRQEQLRTQAQHLARQRTLLERLERRTDPAALGSWVSELLEQKLGEQERPPPQQLSTASRLTDLEALLRNLEAKTEEVLRRQVSVTPPPVSVPVGTDSEAHDSLLEKVQRLEVELGHLRQDLQGALEAQERCEQLETLPNGVSAQVKQELRMLFYGSEEAAGADVPVPLLPWLSARFTSGSDLRRVLSALEHSILKNVSLWVKQSKQTPCGQTASCPVSGGLGTAGVSEREVRLIVQNALRLYSQDQTGLVDYALESGGGSILGTRCSETYETRSALMTLFGLPLWYFTQSPRVVIQPDVHPGNCWPFKGSKGFLLIRLSRKIIPTAVSLEHLAKALSPIGNISSAPRHFEVYGLENELQDEGILLGKFTYEEDGESLQTFPTSEQIEQAFQIIELQVLSNWGHPDYTCLYRFRVHGEPSDQ
ncbi:SUN domain-containing protein 1 isoform X6 [Brienomyrus brachyistius]|uniref:SUN domain-containing protein 1 isoform X6 n=1 Tax=Brienomyrus brachyistius TaxID=42636 RepID=UPI0020B35150|nr:SUN domain-containing protein 1 isoform X6 [Brienomyrus brachyistius]